MSIFYLFGHITLILMGFSFFFFFLNLKIVLACKSELDANHLFYVSGSDSYASIVTMMVKAPGSKAIQGDLYNNTVKAHQSNLRPNVKLL